MGVSTKTEILEPAIWIKLKSAMTYYNLIKHNIKMSEKVWNNQWKCSRLKWKDGV